MAIVDMYRAAGLRHLEDPTQRDQMSLFAIPAPLAPLPEASIPSDVPMAGIPADHTLISDAELTSVADRLDDLAARVEELLRIS
jgi:hypothetical protein